MSRGRNRFQRQDGFTLLEITVAFAILVVSIGALLESFSLAASRSVRSVNLLRATEVATSVRARLNRDLPLTEGRQGTSGGDCDWSVVPVAEAPRPDVPQPILIAVDTTVTAACGAAGDRQTATLRSLELKTAP